MTPSLLLVTVMDIHYVEEYFYDEYRVGLKYFLRFFFFFFNVYECVSEHMPHVWMPVEARKGQWIL